MTCGPSEAGRDGNEAKDSAVELLESIFVAIMDSAVELLEGALLLTVFPTCETNLGLSTCGS